MIRGIGADIVDTERIRALVDRHGDRFLSRILTRGERQRYDRQRDPIPYLARRFAAKEAAAKALGCGIADGVRFADIRTGNDRNGCPLLRFTGVAGERAASLGVRASHISLSDERQYAVAFVVLEG